MFRQHNDGDGVKRLALSSVSFLPGLSFHDPMS